MKKRVERMKKDGERREVVVVERERERERERMAGRRLHCWRSAVGSEII